MFAVIDCCSVIIIPKTLKSIAIWAVFQKCEGWKWTFNWFKFYRVIRHLQSRLFDARHRCMIPCLCSQTLKPTLDISIECLLSTNQATPSLCPKILLLNLIFFHFLPSFDLTRPHPASFLVGTRVFPSVMKGPCWEVDHSIHVASRLRFNPAIPLLHLYACMASIGTTCYFMWHLF